MPTVAFSTFGRYVGIDYSGAATLDSSLRGLRMYMAQGAAPAEEVLPPPGPRARETRAGVACATSESRPSPCFTSMCKARSRNLPIPVCRGCVIYAGSSEAGCISGRSMAGAYRLAARSWRRFIPHCGGTATRGRTLLPISTTPTWPPPGCRKRIAAGYCRHRGVGFGSGVRPKSAAWSRAGAAADAQAAAARSSLPAPSALRTRAALPAPRG